MNQLNIAVWGLGRHAVNRILPILAAMDEVKLLGVCSRNSETVAKIAKQWSCNDWYSPGEMLNHRDLDVVYIATPIGLHFTMAEQVLKAGKSVWCEKPLTCNYEDSQALIMLAKKNGCVLTESFMHLHHPQFKRVKRFVDESSKVNSIICRFGIPKLDVPGFRNDPQLCGGALWDVGSYTISTVLALFPGQQTEVLFSEVVKKENELVDSEGRAMLRFSSGTVAYIEWMIGVSYKNEIDIWSVDGALFTDKIFSKPKNYQPSYFFRDLNGNMSIEQEDVCEQFVEMFSNFVHMAGDDEKIETERESILQRAKLLNDIVKF